MPFGVSLYTRAAGRSPSADAVRALASGNELVAVLRHGAVEARSLDGREERSPIAIDATSVGVSGREVFVAGRRLERVIGGEPWSHALPGFAQGVAANDRVLWCHRATSVHPFVRSGSTFVPGASWEARGRVLDARASADGVWLLTAREVTLHGPEGEVLRALSVPRDPRSLGAGEERLAVLGANGEIVVHDLPDLGASSFHVAGASLLGLAAGSVVVFARGRGLLVHRRDDAGAWSVQASLDYDGDARCLSTLGARVFVGGDDVLGFDVPS